MAKTDLAKAWIYGSLALSVIGLGTHFYLKQRVSKAETNTKRALAELGEIAAHHKDIQTLENEKRNDQFVNAGEGRQGAYFETQAQRAGLDQNPNLGKPRDDTPRGANGFQDVGYELTWSRRQGETGGFTRRQIAQFLLNIEKNSKLLKVSEITLDAANPRDLQADLWVPRIWVTERRPKTTP